MDNSKKIRVLLVEDNRIAQKIGSIVLQSLGCEVDIIDNGATALKFFGENHYNLVFMDLGLPGKDGYSIAAEIREIEKKFSLEPTPIICLSVHVSESFRTKALKVGMNDYITKPLTLENCKSVLKRFFSANFLIEENI
jgi:two-component system aerobic respiration control sensor histidine kinase ArcB